MSIALQEQKGADSAGASLRSKPIYLAATIGNALETFDSLMYGFLAVIMASVFFPRSDSTVPILLTFATFSIGYVVRPFGSLILGMYGDRYGRRRGLALTIWLMLVGTALIAFAPSYSSAGIIAPAIVVLARLFQGLGASGEYGNSLSLLAEGAVERQKHFYSASVVGSTMIGVVTASLVGWAISHELTEAELMNWGWRLPFLVGLLIGPLGYYIRTRIDETLDTRQEQGWSIPRRLRELFGTHLRALLISACLSVIGLSAYYLNYVYLPTFAVRELKLPLSAPFLVTTIAGTVCAASAFAIGAFVDRIRAPRLIYGISVATVGVLVLPLLQWVIASPSLANLLIVEVILAVPHGAITGLLASVTAGLFPPRARAAGLGVSWNVTSALFGGVAPLIVTYATGVTGNKAAAGFYLTAAAIISLAAILYLNYGSRRRPPATTAS